MEDFLNKSRSVAMWTRRAIKAGLNVNFLEALRMSEILYLDGCMKTKDAVEGISAFMEKRKPVWKDE
jgi:cyclohexa-1,5-dienecarbonyl-CoA hydratase